MRKFYLMSLLLSGMLSTTAMASTKDDLAGATADNPKDATYLIGNAKMDSTGYWTVVGPSWGLQSANYTNGDVVMEGFYERWIRNPQTLPDGYIYQTIEGLPKGTYRFSAACISTQQSRAGATQTGTWLFVRHDASGDSIEVSTGNNVPERINCDFILNADGDIQIGFGTYGTSSNWVAVDNFTLTYYGDGIGLFKNNLLDKMDDLRAKMELGIYTGLATEIEAELTAAESLYNGSATTVADIDAEIAKMDSLMGKADESAAAYEGLIVAVDSASTTLGLDANKFDLSIIDGYLVDNAIDEVVDGHTADTEKCGELTAGIYKAILQTLCSGIKEGEDATFILNNPGFDNGKTGWSYSGTSPGVNYSAMEFYNHVFDCWQEIEGVPDGTYTLNVQAFIRTNANAAAYENYLNGIEVKAKAYVNDSEQPIVNVMSQASEQCLGTGDYQNAGGTYTPNNMEGASAYMAAGYYETTVKGVAANGKLRVGIKLQDVEGYNSYWVLFDNFRLTYNGADISEMAEQKDKQTAEAEKLYDQPMNADSLTALKTAVEAANTAATSSALAAALGQLTVATSAAKSSIKTYTALGEALAASKTKVNKYKSEGGSYTTNYNAVNEKMLAGGYADAEIAAQVIFVKTFTNQWLLEDVVAGTTPTDVSFVIDNPAFEDNTNSGWNFTGSTGAVSYNLQEFFNINFDMYQQLYGMKAGKYRLVVQGFYRCGLPAELGDALNAKIYVNDAETSLMSITEGLYEGTTPGSVVIDAETGMSVPNTMEAASWFFDSLEVKKYAGNEVTYEYKDTSADFVIGMKKDVTVNRDWSIINGFQLYYIGTTNGIEETASNAQTVAIEYYDINGRRISGTQKGVIIVKIKKADGSVETRKLIRK